MPALLLVASMLLAWMPNGSHAPSYGPIADPIRDSARVLLERGRTLRAAKKQYQSLAVLRAAAALLEHDNRPSNDTLLGDVLLETGRVFGELCEFDSLQVFYDRVLAVRSRVFGAESPQVAEVLHLVGGHRAGQSDAQGSIAIRERALKMLGNDTSHWRLAVRLSNALALLHAGIDNGDHARFYFDHAYAMLGSPPRDTFWLGILLDNEAKNLFGPLNQLDAAFRNTRLSAQWMAGKDNPDWWLNHLDVQGNLYLRNAQPDSALICHQQLLAGLLRQPQPSPTLVAHAMGSIATDFMQLREPDSSLFWLQKSFDIQLQTFGQAHGYFYAGYRHAGLCHLMKNQPDEARRYFLKSLEANNFANNSVAALRNPGAGCLALAELARLHAQRGAMAESLHCFAQADSAVLRWRATLQESGSRERISDFMRPMYEDAMETARQVFEQSGDPAMKNLAFRFAERCKSIALSEAVRAVDVRARLKIPAELRQLEDSLRRETTLAERLRAEGNISDSLAHRLEAKFWRCKTQLDALHDLFEREYGLAGVQKQQAAIADPDTLPDYARRTGSVVVSYFTGATHLHVFVAHSDGLEWFTSHIGTAELLEKTSALRTVIAMPPEDLTDAQAVSFPKEYAAAAHWLFREVFQTAERFFPKGISRAVIVPDGCLSLLPFEVMLKKLPAEAARFAAHDYLLRHYTFAYAPSVTLLGQMEGRRVEPEKTYLGIAPLFTDSLPPLKQTGRGTAGGRLDTREIGRPLEYFGGDTLFGLAASKERFMAVCERYQVLHFVTHGHADPANPLASWLMLFSADGSFLRSDEIALLRLNADLVFLNACETGFGPVQPVEGVQSIGRAFMLAGAKSIVATGWRVDESVAVRMSDEFYRTIFSGKNKDEALATAKRKILADPILAHPFFWGGYVIWGDRARLF